MASNNPYAPDYVPEEEPKNPYAPEPPSALGREVVRQGIDVGKQILSAPVRAAESALTFIPTVTGAVGGLVEKIPGFAPDPQEAANRAALLEATKGARQPLTRYLPEAETGLGQTVGKAAETAITTALNPFKGGLSLARAAGVGATAGAVGDVAGQAAKGTALEPYAEPVATLIAGTAAARQAERAAAKAAVPTIKETKAAGGELFDAFRKSGFAVDPAAGPQFAGALKAELRPRGLTGDTVPDTYKVLDKIADLGPSPAPASPLSAITSVTKQAAPKPPIDPVKFHELYQELGAVKTAAKDANERFAAGLAQERLLGMLEAMPPGFVVGGNPTLGAGLLQKANQDWAAAKRAENVSGRITKAEQVASGQYSGLGLENELRRRLGILGLPPEATAGRPPVRGLSEAERRAFEQFGEGTTGQNIRRYLTGALSGRGGIGVGGLSLGGGALANYLGVDPLISGGVGVGLPVAGVTLAMLGNRSALSRARDLERMLLARSNLANRPGTIPQPSPFLPLATLPPTLSTLGE